MDDSPAGPGQGGADLASTNPDHTPQPAALVNEAFPRMAGKALPWASRTLFPVCAANVTGQIPIGHARARWAFQQLQEIAPA